MGLSEEPVRIRNSEDLFTVLSEGSMGARLAVLRDIVAQPERAIALGSHQGEDFVDLLIRLIPESSGPIKKALTLCLMSYQDPRTTTFLCQLFAKSRDAATVLHLAQRVGMEKERDFFLPYIWGQKQAQALAAARVLSLSPDLLSDRERLRVALLLDRPFDPPALNKATLPFWVEELVGPNRALVKALIESRGAEVLALWPAWEKLPDEEKEWLLAVSEPYDPLLVRQHLERLLAEPDVSRYAARAAEARGLQLPPSLLSHSDPEVRALAVAAGHDDDHLDLHLDPESPLPLAVAAVLRCKEPRLLQLLKDQRWQVRGAAVRALALAPSPPLEAIRSLLAETRSQTLRATTVELLLACGDDDWLADHLKLKL